MADDTINQDDFQRNIRDLQRRINHTRLLIDQASDECIQMLIKLPTKEGNEIVKVITKLKHDLNRLNFIINEIQDNEKK